MRDTCTITRPGEQVWNPETLQYDEATFVVYTGRCRIKGAGMRDRAMNAADQEFLESQRILSLPIVGSEGVRKDDTVVIDSSESDLALVGVPFTVIARPASSDATARRFPVRETQ
jgi:hypothetical protein